MGSCAIVTTAPSFAAGSANKPLTATLPVTAALAPRSPQPVTRHRFPPLADSVRNFPQCQHRLLLLPSFPFPPSSFAQSQTGTSPPKPLHGQVHPTASRRFLWGAIFNPIRNSAPSEVPSARSKNGTSYRSSAPQRLPSPAPRHPPPLHIDSPPKIPYPELLAQCAFPCLCVCTAGRERSLPENLAYSATGPQFCANSRVQHP